MTRLLGHRLPWDVPEKEAKDLWREIVEGTSDLWDGIDGDKREILHRFFVFFESERESNAFSSLRLSGAASDRDPYPFL